MVDLFTVSQAAKVLACHPDTIRRLDRKGIIKAKRDYRGYRIFKKEEIYRLKDEREKLRDK